VLRIVAAPAELDAVSANRFASELGDAEPVVVDCHRVEFIDSSGLKVLLEARQRVAAEGGQVVLRRPTEVVLRLLQVTATDELFTIEG
jgi:anti-anti-sigma factor